MERKVLEKKFN